MATDIRKVTSRQNPLVARFRAAARDRSEILIDGPHLVEAALEAGLALAQVVYRTEAADRDEIRRLVARASAAGAEIVAATAAVMDAVSPVRSASPIVALASRPSRPRSPFAGPSPLVAIADGIQDPGNVGAIVRVAEAAGASGVALTGPSADPLGWKALRGSMGSALRLPLATYEVAEDAVVAARAARCAIVAAVPDSGRDLFDVDLRGAAAIVVGAEGSGVSPALVAAADLRVTIPMRPPVESLNAAVAAALILYEARRQRQ